MLFGVVESQRPWQPPSPSSGSTPRNVKRKGRQANGSGIAAARRNLLGPRREPRCKATCGVDQLTCTSRGRRSTCLRPPFPSCRNPNSGHPVEPLFQNNDRPCVGISCLPWRLLSLCHISTNRAKFLRGRKHQRRPDRAHPHRKQLAARNPFHDQDAAPHREARDRAPCDPVQGRR